VQRDGLGVVNPIVVRRTHRLDAATARRMAETIAGRMRREFGGTFDWDGDTLRFSRTGASGHVDLGEREVTVHVDLGLLLRPLRSRIEREIHAYLDDLGTATPQAARPAARRSTSTRSSRSQAASRSVRPK
jgi:putative polyhydroxyalkanoate system protein